MRWTALCIIIAIFEAILAADFHEFTNSEAFEEECNNTVILDENAYKLKIRNNGTTKTPLALLVPKTNGFTFNIDSPSVIKEEGREYRVDFIFRNDDNFKTLFLSWDSSDAMVKVLHRVDKIMDPFGLLFKPTTIATFYVHETGEFTMENLQSGSPLATIDTLRPSDGISYNDTHSILLLDIMWAWVTKPMVLIFPKSNITVGCMIRKFPPSKPPKSKTMVSTWAIIGIVVGVAILAIAIATITVLVKLGVCKKICKCRKKKKPRKNRHGITRPQPLTLSEDKEFDRIRKGPSGKGFIIVPIPQDTEQISQGIPVTSAEHESIVVPSRSQEPTQLDSMTTALPSRSQEPTQRDSATHVMPSQDVDSMAPSEFTEDVKKSASKSNKDAGKTQSTKIVKKN